MLRVKEYRAYIVGPDGHLLARIDLLCADDDAARQRARALVGGHPIELWREKNLIAEFQPDPQDPLAPSATP
jgi:hypothetical protein